MVGMSNEPPTTAEQETAIAWSRGDDEIRIWSSIPADVRELRRLVAAGSAREVANDGDRWADFRIPRGRWSLRGFKPVITLTDERKTKLTDWLRARRAAPDA